METHETHSDALKKKDLSIKVIRIQIVDTVNVENVLTFEHWLTWGRIHHQQISKSCAGWLVVSLLKTENNKFHFYHMEAANHNQLRRLENELLGLQTANAKISPWAMSTKKL